MFNHTTEVLPIEPLLPDLLETLGSGTRCILEAAPGAGKTTRVPFGIAPGGMARRQGILMLEPGAWPPGTRPGTWLLCLGKRVGQTVGYRCAWIPG